LEVTDKNMGDLFTNFFSGIIPMEAYIAVSLVMFSQEFMALYLVKAC